MTNNGIYNALIDVLPILIFVLLPTASNGSVLNETSEDTIGSAQTTKCIEYDPVQNLVKVKCEYIHLTDIYNTLDNPGILRIEDNDDSRAKVWILNAGIDIDKKASLIIDSTDTSWLKIAATPTMQLKLKSVNLTNGDDDNSNHTITLNITETGTKAMNMDNNSEIEDGTIIVSKNNGDNPNGIHVGGSLMTDSVKITSWDAEKKDVIEFDFGKRHGEEHTKSDYDTAEPRAFIRVSKDASGTTNITNSELAYLGYSCSRCAGLSYYGGEGSVIKNSNIHHLLKGFYSKNMGHMIIEGNKFHDNYLYGIDPHTGSHDMIIRNNKVYDNNASGIICSKDCYNLLIEGNEVYRSGGAGRGIAFSINTTNSIARNNDVHNNENCISFNRESNNNHVYKNTISNCDIAIDLSKTSRNSIDDNSIINSKTGIVIKGTSNNVTNNTIDKTKTGISYVNKITNTTDLNTEPYNKTKIEHYLHGLESTNKLLDVSNPSLLKTGHSEGLKELLD